MKNSRQYEILKYNYETYILSINHNYYSGIKKMNINRVLDMQSDNNNNNDTNNCIKYVTL